MGKHFSFMSHISPPRTTTRPTLHTLVRFPLAVSKSMAAKSFMRSVVTRNLVRGGRFRPHKTNEKTVSCRSAV